jgi:hypothetical protein
LPDVPVPAGSGDGSETARLDEVTGPFGSSDHDPGVDGQGVDGQGDDGPGDDGPGGDELFALEPDPALIGAVRELTETTDELLALGDRLPVLRDVPARAWSLQIVRASALAVLLGAVLLGLGIWQGILGVWWLPVVLAMVPAAVRMVLLGVAPAAGRHRRQRYAAAVTGAAALLVAPVAAVFGWPQGLLAVLAFGIGASVLLELRWGRS